MGKGRPTFGNHRERRSGEMKLYEINEALQNLIDRMVDPETGEI